MINTDDPTNASLPLVVFRLQDQEFALPIVEVTQLLRMVALTPVPDAPPWLAGIINLRGRVVQVMDLRTRLGFTSRPPNLDHRIMVVENGDSILGLIVDAISDVRTIPGEWIETSDPSSAITNLVTSVARFDDRLIAILNLDTLLSNAQEFLLSTSQEELAGPFAEDDQDQSAVQSILTGRARALATASKTETASDDMTVVVLRVGKEKYGVAMRFVSEVRPLDQVTLLPGAPGFYAGLVNLRGRIYGVLDLRRYLGLAEGEPVAKAKLVLVAAGGIEMGLRVDDVLGAQRATLSQFQPLLAEASDRPGVVTGVTPDLLSMLDLEALLADPALVVKQESN
ncbi:MAG: chemotaxis protein CheW [Chloroflexi bacterium]|nr:chemotaxis protein CheW [Chloroflexota bacterium]